MKTPTIIATLGVVIIVLIVGYFAFRSSPTEAPTPTPSPEFQEVQTSPGASNLGQYIQLQPSSTPPTATTSPEPSSVPAISSTPASEAVTISLDDTGFHPATVTIKSGTTVTFVNNGQAEHWPASDVHPTHQILPEFDAKRGLATGETYSFTFVKVGSWPMHDHLSPSHTGTIIVQ